MEGEASSSPPLTEWNLIVIIMDVNYDNIVITVHLQKMYKSVISIIIT